MTYEEFLQIVDADFAINCGEVDKTPLNTILMAKSTEATTRYGTMLLKLATGELGSLQDPALKGHVRQFLTDLGFDIPAGIPIRIEFRESDEFIILLPSKPVMKAALCVAREADAGKAPSGFEYKVPQPYPDQGSADTARTHEELLKFIVGDYSMRYCR